MKIIRKYPETMGVKDLYDLTQNPNTRKMTNCAGQRLELAAWAIYEDVKNDGEIVTITAIKTVDGDTVATNSAAFRRAFCDMIDLCESVGAPMPEAVEVSKGVTRAGREFVTCVMC